MDQFIVLSDFDTLIDEDNLDELINERPRILEDAIPESIEEAACHIRHRYDEDQVFAVVTTFVLGTVYVVGDRIIWSPAAYVPANTYNTDDVVSHDTGTVDSIYKAKEDTITGVFDPTKWDLIVGNNTHYSVIVVNVGTELPSDVTKFTKGDTRNPKLVHVVVDILIYNIHSRVTPRNVPEERTIIFL